MASRVADACAALRDALEVIPDLVVSEFVPPETHPPHAVIYPTEIIYHQAMAHGAPNLTLAVDLLVGRSNEQEAQERLYDLMDPDRAGSVPYAVELDATWGGVVQTSVCRTAGQIRPVQHGDAQYLAVTFTVDCWL